MIDFAADYNLELINSDGKQMNLAKVFPLISGHSVLTYAVMADYQNDETKDRFRELM